VLIDIRESEDVIRSSCGSLLLRQVMQSRMESHAALVHRAEPRGFLNCPRLFVVLNVGLCETAIQQPEVRWVGWVGTRSRYSGTSLRLLPGLLALFGILRAADEMSMRFLHLYVSTSASYQAMFQILMKKNRTHPRLVFFPRAALHNAKKPHAVPCGFAQPVYSGSLRQFEDIETVGINSSRDRLQRGKQAGIDEKPTAA
jgi:hypothetical protein